jgi:hypothetical protein
MADNLTFSGRLIIVAPAAVIDSARPKVTADIREQLSVYPSLDTAYVLTTDSPVSVNLGGLTNACFVMLKGDGPFTATITNINHSAQEIDGEFLVLESSTYPITALTLTRLPGGIQRTVRVVIAQQATTFP